MIIETKHLTKTFKGKGGFKNVTLGIEKGEIFGFLGPNGAGKSTFVKTMLALLHPTSGEGYILGKPLGDVKARKDIGYLPELFRFQEYLTAEELLRFHARLYEMDLKETAKRIDEVLTLCGIIKFKKNKIKTYSKGMQQRLGLASALLSSPQVIFLDEPTSALDPVGRKEIRDIIQGLKDKNTTVFLNSHLLGEVELVCDHVAIINDGFIVASGRLDELLNRQKKVWIRLKDITEQILSSLKKTGFKVTALNNSIEIEIEEEKSVPFIVKNIIENEGEIYEVNIIKSNLEEVFIGLLEEAKNGSNNEH